MKIIIKDNFGRDLFIEHEIAENVNEVIGEQMVNTWNDKHWNEHSDFYLALVEDNYELYNGYKELL